MRRSRKRLSGRKNRKRFVRGAVKFNRRNRSHATRGGYRL